MIKRVVYLAMLLTLGQGTAWALGLTADEVDALLGTQNDSLVPHLSGQQKFAPKHFHQEADWQNQSADPDIHPFNDQSSSLIQWEKIDPVAWMDIKAWIKERDFKDKTPEWRINLRQKSKPELVGKVISCVGTCEIYRGIKPVKAQYLSRIEEGDEIRTLGESYAWVYLVDGTLVRLSPVSSMSFNEVNFTSEKAFFSVRANEGQIYWLPRKSEELIERRERDTDMLFLPLMEKTCNNEFFEREAFRSLPENQRAAFEINSEANGRDLLYKKLNEMIVKNNMSMKKMTHQSFIVSPAGSVMNQGEPLILFAALGGKLHIKIPSLKEEYKGLEESTEETKAEFFYRGYSNAENYNLKRGRWYEVSETGREIAELVEAPSFLTLSELLPRRISSLLLLRETWTLTFSAPLVESLVNPKKLAMDYGYSLWGKELSRREEYLKEYTRRIETTNLFSLKKLLLKLADKGEFAFYEYSDRYFSRALDAYLKAFNMQYHSSQATVKDMDATQYYGWVLLHAKKP